jgi:hypothetical protein
MIGFHEEETCGVRDVCTVTLSPLVEILHQFFIYFLMWAVFNNTFQLRYITERVTWRAVLLTLQSGVRAVSYRHVAGVGKQGMRTEVSWEIAWVICHSENGE